MPPAGGNVGAAFGRGRLISRNDELEEGIPETVSVVMLQSLWAQVETIQNLGFLGLFVAAIIGRCWG